MNRDQIFDLWCPAWGRWSPWVKPVLFSFMSDTAVLPSGQGVPPAWDLNGLPTAREDVALVLDLPGGEGVRLSTSFVAAGFRPVPLYNALPWVEGSGFLLVNQHPPVVNMVDIVQALRAATAELEKTPLADDAPPVFMLDANRRTAMGPALPGSFDNRSISFPTDFPSANFLLGNRIQRAILVVRGKDQPEADLSHTLRQWQDAGVHIELKRLDQPDPPHTCEIAKPSWYRGLLYRAAELMHFRKSALGGFGGVLATPSAG